MLVDASLSPDGTRLAILRERWTAGKRSALIHVLPADNPKAPPHEIIIGDNNVIAIGWANESRLMVTLQFDKTPDGKPTGIMRYNKIYPVPVTRLMFIGADGSKPTLAFVADAAATDKVFNLAVVVDKLERDPDLVLMERWDTVQNRLGLFRVNVNNGLSMPVEFGERATVGWECQDGMAVLRYDANQRRTVFTVFARAPGEDKWKLVRKLRRNELQKLLGFDVVGASSEPGVMLVSSRAENEQYYSVRKYDLKTLAFGEVVAAVEGRDVDSLFQDASNRIIAVAYTADRLGYSFQIPGLAGHYKGLSAYFGNDCNLALADVDREANRFLIRVSGPRHPGGYVLYDVKAKHLEELGDAQPWLTTDRLAPMETLKIKTRDGAEIGAYLTRPLGEVKNRPMVVMPHGGPEVRDSRGYHRQVQALAARGWLVLQPNFRGSGGLGVAFADAGRKRWGDRMQEDVEDAVAHVIAGGWADPKKIAIFGFSYGGYAALMGAVRKPQIYRCAVAGAAPADLMKMMDFEAKEGTDSPGYLYWARTMGDPNTDAAMLRAASPALQVDAIDIPILIVQGDEDYIVPVEQGRLMAKALAKAGKPHEYWEIEGEGHGGFERDVELKYLTRVIDFIARAFA
ncbi:S9 family peptidase [Caulobacter sp. NIBR1757]|uniref:alpha/beta hydrolase family protein n=1 Tax=Caulobacter sp. NIBR1757 TaxID=3016000 RepID=UPI0022EFE565|nr:S9 family peptidase [Caulobacter sp. NIBR1757]